MTQFDINSSLDDITREEIIDTRDLAEILDEAEGVVGDMDDFRDDPTDWDGEPPHTEEEEQAAREWVRVLGDLRDEIGNEWSHGETLIHEDYFTEYAQQLADDCYEVPDAWPCTCIDWERAARDLKHDYSKCEINGETYLFRCS